MLSALKQLDKKFLIIMSVLIVLPIFTMIILAVLQGCESGSSFESYEKNMIKAAKKYVGVKKTTPTSEGQIVTVTLDQMVKNNFIKNPEKSLHDSTCKGNVTIRRNGSSVESTGGGFLNYTVNLECKDYKTIHFKDLILKNLVESGSGLYLDGDTYVFKGDKPNNYLNFDGKIYRIMEINSDGLVKLAKAEQEGISRRWDDKYNIDVNKYSGKTIYKDSVILQYLLMDYENPKKITKKAKLHVTAANACIGKRDVNDTKISKDIDCSDILPAQLVTLMNISDYARASTDENCDSIVAKSCNNYNYLRNFMSSTWTMNSVNNNTYDVFYIADGSAMIQSANANNNYNMIIYVDGNENNVTGTGTLTDPYFISVD